MRQLTTKEKGNALENLISAYLEDIDPHNRPTVGSGASHEIADILNRYFYIESKYRSTEDFTIKNRVWRKLCSEIPIGSKKIPLYIIANQDKETLVIMDIKDFIRIAQKVYKE